MAKFLDADGNEVEAFTQAEVEANAKEAVEKARLEVDASVAKEREELERLKTEEKNWNELRNKAAAAEGQKTEAEKKADEALAAAKDAQAQASNLISSQLESTKSETIKALAGDDVELQKKIAFHFDNSTSGATGTKEEIQARVRNAYVLATASPSAGIFTGAAVSGAAGGSPPANTTTLSADAMDLGRRFGIPDDVLKKHSKPGNA